jgi:hypothetical protein
MPQALAKAKTPKQNAKERIQVSRVQKVQREIITRYDRVANLWISFHNSGKYVDEFAREFYHAVGRILQGIQLAPEDLTIELHEVVNNQAFIDNGGHKRDKEIRQASREVRG